MKKYQSLLFYIKNKHIKLDFCSIISNYITPICKVFHYNIDILNYYGDFFDEAVEKECKYDEKQLFQNFYVDLNNQYLQRLSFLSGETSHDEWPIFQIVLNYKLNELELRIDYENRIFTSINGTHIHPDTCTDILNKIIKKYNLPKITFHDLRHSSTSMLIHSGVDIKLVSERLGHSNTNTTMNIYTHTYKEDKYKSADAIDDIMDDIS